MTCRMRFTCRGSGNYPSRARGAAGWLVNGWSLNSLVNWQSGFPINVVSGRDNSFSGEKPRPTLTSSAEVTPISAAPAPHGAMVKQYFNTAEFTANAVGTFRQHGARGIIRLPRQFNNGRFDAQGYEAEGADDAAIPRRALQTYSIT